MTSPFPTDSDAPAAETAATADAATVERSTMVPAPPDEVLAVLSDPDVMPVWLGEWSSDDATVRTDDGVLRRVTEHRVGDDHVRWTWSPEHDPEDRSDVVLTVAPAGPHTHLTVTETRRPVPTTGTASMSLAPVGGRSPRRAWTGELLTIAVWCQARTATLVAV